MNKKKNGANKKKEYPDKEVGKKDKYHGPYILGFRRDTMVHTKRKWYASINKKESESKFGSYTETRICEVGIVSNRRSGRYGEIVFFRALIACQCGKEKSYE